MNRIRAAREAQGWSQDQLARQAGVASRTVHAIEKGKNCRQATKRKVLSALGVPWELRDEYFPRPIRVEPRRSDSQTAQTA
ncbi:MAG: helix-turn-helix transcriptional regulator [Myxococcales bacterium]|nr:helix-turn-helix transcriptional regulator [Myxococcales bacterium]